MYDNDRDTADSRNPESKESLSLRGGSTTGCSDSLSARVQETRQQKAERLGWMRLPIYNRCGFQIKRNSVGDHAY